MTLTHDESLILLGLSLLLLTFLFIGMLRSAEPARSATSPVLLPDSATPEEQEAALSFLATLPHIRCLSDGSLIDFLNGAQIHMCECGGYPIPHLEVRYDRNNAIAFYTRSGLTRYQAVQSAVAARLAMKEPS